MKQEKKLLLNSKNITKSILIQGILYGLLMVICFFIVYYFMLPPETDIIKYRCEINKTIIEINKSHNLSYACNTFFSYGVPVQRERNYNVENIRNNNISYR